MILNGGCVQKTTNVVAALRRLGHSPLRNQQDHYWLYALCISQGDTAEKNEQVRLMSDIHRMTAVATAWLG